MKKRSEVLDEYKWDFSLLYNSDQEFWRDLNEVGKCIINLSSYDGHLNNKDSIVRYLKEDESVLKILSKMQLYAMMRVDVCMTDSDAIKMQDAVSNVEIAYGEQTAFVVPELSLLDDDFLTSLINDAELKDYNRIFYGVLRNKLHMLSKQEEKLMAGMGSFAGFDEVFDNLADVEMKFDEVDFNGKKNTLNNANYGLFIKSSDRLVRKQAHENLHKEYSKYNLTLSTNYINYLKKCDFVARTYKFDSAFNRALFNEEVDEKVYDKLIKNVHKALPLYHKYISTKARVLSISDFCIYDLLAPVGDDSNFNLPYKEAAQLVKEALNCLGPEYGALLNKAFNNRWIDVFPNEGKKSGAYSVSVGVGAPFVLLNYNQTYNEISTIAHELGHSMHSYHSEKNQPFYKQNYVITVAEVASTVNEVLLAKYILKNAKDKELKKFIIDSLLNQFSSTVYRQTMFSEFEYQAHKLVNDKKPISYVELNSIYDGLQKLYFKDTLKLHKYAKFEWSRIPHFYRAFYVFKYATGFISAIKIAHNIETGGEEYVKKYLNFLSSGCSDDPISLLKIADVDLTKDETYMEAFKYFEDLIEEFGK